MDAPKGLIHFSNTPIGNELSDSTKNMKILLVIINLAFVFSAIYWPANLLLITILLIVIDVILIRSLISASASVPLAVNLNHPFMESEPISKSEIMVKFSEEWIDPGVHRLKLAKDCLLYTSPSPRDATLSRMPSSA